MREIRQSGSEGGAKLTFVPTPMLSPGFYEAELVKSSLRKSVLKSFWFIWAAI